MTLDALALALADLTPQQRREFAAFEPGKPVEALVVALKGNELCGAAWGQRQPGSTALLWPPQLRPPTNRDTAVHLACAATAALDEAGIRMTQVLLPDRSAPNIPELESAGFACLADLMYLNWEAAATRLPGSNALSFDPFAESQRERFVAAIEATYEATHDCAALNGKRPMEEVLVGYRATGQFRPENWLIVVCGGEDVGVLLLADHEAAKHWELLYMGLAPPARGRKLGSAVVAHAQQLAHRAGAERIVLAVDAENIPAIKMYNETGFVAWDRRTVMVRFAPDDSQTQKTP